MYFLLNMGICHCHVTLPESNSLAWPFGSPWLEVTSPGRFRVTEKTIQKRSRSQHWPWPMIFLLQFKKVTISGVVGGQVQDGIRGFVISMAVETSVNRETAGFPHIHYQTKQCISARGNPSNLTQTFAACFDPFKIGVAIQKWSQNAS